VPRCYNQDQLAAVIRKLLRFSRCELLLLEAGNWGRGQFGDPAERERSVVRSRHQATEVRTWQYVSKNSVCPVIFMLNEFLSIIRRWMVFWNKSFLRKLDSTSQWYHCFYVSYDPKRSICPVSLMLHNSPKEECFSWRRVISVDIVALHSGLTAIFIRGLAEFLAPWLTERADDRWSCFLGCLA
jgi:hypothetical protein